MTNEWLEYKLADLCDSIDYGFTTSAKDEPVGPKFLRITDIVSGHIDCEIRGHHTYFCSFFGLVPAFFSFRMRPSKGMKLVLCPQIPLT
jgi:hypothetical protein